MKNGLRLIALFLCISAAIVATGTLAHSATYYVDYAGGSDSNSGTTKSSSWQRAPGMVGFAGSYSHSAGDVIIFKGGVTWPASALPFSVKYSGAAGQVDTYTTDHSWYAGSGWSQPVLDGGGNKTNLVNASQKSYFKLDDLKIIGVGTPGATGSTYTFNLANCQQFEVSNMTIASEAWIGLYAYNDKADRKSGYVFHNNDISRVAMGLVVATSAANSIISDVRISNNKFHDFASQLVGGRHGDGIHTWGKAGDSSQYITDMQIYGNSFYGDWTFVAPSTGTTAFIYIEDKTINAQVYNNSGTYSSAPVAGNISRFIYAKGTSTGGGGHKFYNNTFRGTNPGPYSGIQLISNPNCEIKNNIFANIRYIYDIDSASTAGLSIDYNNAYYLDASAVGAVSGSQKSWSQWQTLGYDKNGMHQDPKFVSTSVLSLQPTSPCIGKGTDLSTYFSTDINGNYRTRTWDMGAFSTTGTTVGPSLLPPTLKSVQ